MRSSLHKDRILRNINIGSVEQLFITMKLCLSNKLREVKSCQMYVIYSTMPSLLAMLTESGSTLPYNIAWMENLSVVYNEN